MVSLRITKMFRNPSDTDKNPSSATSKYMEIIDLEKEQTLACTVSEVRVTPCAEALTNQPCVCRKGKNSTISFDFQGKPGVSFTDGQAYWPTALGDIPLKGMDTDACKYTECPVKDGMQTYTYALLIEKFFPVNKYTVKWRLWKDNEISCCFLFKIDIKRKA